MDHDERCEADGAPTGVNAEADEVDEAKGTTRVYKYGLLPPTENNDLVRAQLRAAHVYRNALVEIERARRAATRTAMKEIHADLLVLEAALVVAKESAGEAAASIKAARQETRSKSESADARAKLAAAKLTARDAARALAAKRREAREDPLLIAVLDGVNNVAGEARRAKRAQCGVYWGSYLLVEAAMDASSKLPLFDGERPNDPRFARWDGAGRLGVQLQGGLLAEDAFGSDTRLRVDSVDARSESASRSERRRYARTVLRIRVGSEGRDPVWAAWPMVMHRPLPPAGVIKNVSVQLRKIGPREEWTACFTVTSSSSGDRPKRRVPDIGVVAVDLGWRVIDDELRVASWMASDGEAGELRLSAVELSALTKASGLRSTRDTNFDEARAILVAWLTGQESLPDWLREATKTIGQWKSEARLAALAKRWAENRFEGDVDAYNALERWRYHDHHLWEWESSQRSKSLRRRREVYRVWAASMAQRYQTIIVEKFDLRRVAAKPPTGEEKPKADYDKARSNRQLAAVSELRGCISNAFDGRTVEILSVDTTRACSVCGVVNQFDQAAHLLHTCRDCGSTWDQDRNAATNILALGCEQLRAASGPGGARKGKNGSEITDLGATKWMRTKQLQAEKKLRLEGARTVASTSAKT